MLYVTTELDKAVTVIDPKTLKIVGQIPTGQEQSHMLVLTHDGKHGYTANVGPGTVSVLDMAAQDDCRHPDLRDDPAHLDLARRQDGLWRPTALSRGWRSLTPQRTR